MNKINEALNKRFEEHRIIFWYDGRQELLSLVVGGWWVVGGGWWLVGGGWWWLYQILPIICIFGKN